MKGNDHSNRTGMTASKYFKVTKAAVMVGSIFLFAIMTYVTADVVSRTMANNPLPATLEITLTFMVFIVFLGLAHTQARRMHLKLDFIYMRLSPRGQGIVDILTLAIGLFVVGIVWWEGMNKALEAWSTGEYMEGIWKIPYFPSRLGLAFGAFLLWLQYVLDFVRRFGQLLNTKRGR
jgi:TRAP-type C4-dicarboxylate transport system permease small subunit